MKKAALSGSMTKPNGLTRLLYFSWIKRETLVEIISYLFIILFLYTALNKIVHVPINRIMFGQSPVLKPFADLLAWGVPIAEIIVSVTLFFPKFRLAGLSAALGLMTVFTSYIVIILTTSDELPCSCGGIVQQLSWPQHLVFNSVFIILAIIALAMLIKDRRLKSLQKAYL